MKILIIKTSSFGDIVHTFEMAAFLRSKFPNAQIDWVVEKRCADLVSSLPCINEAIVVDIPSWRKHWMKWSTWKEIRKIFRRIRCSSYDLVFDVQGNTKSAVFVWMSKAAKRVGFGRRRVFELPNLFFTNCKIDPPLDLQVSKENLYIARTYFQDESDWSSSPMLLRLKDEEKVRLEQFEQEKVLVCPGTAWASKRLPLEHLIQILEKIEGLFYIIYGNPDEEHLALKLQRHFSSRAQILPKMSLPLLQHLMSRSRLVIAMDSLPLHLAATTGAATLSFFGASSKDKYGPIGKHHVSVQGGCPYDVQFERRCPHLRTCKTAACMSNVDVNFGFSE